MNEIEAAPDADDDGQPQQLPVDFASLDQSCLSETDTNQNSPVVAAPAVPNGAGIKYIRYDALKKKPSTESLCT